MENAKSTTKIAKDPVCGMTVDPNKAAATAEYEGQPYYFCSKGCAAKFHQNPTKFLATAATSSTKQNTQSDTTSATNSCCSHSTATTPQTSQTAAPPKAGEGVRYTCPMHP